MLEFTCPVCGSHRVIERMDVESVVSEINVINDDGTVEYGDMEASGDVFGVRYECADCDFILPDVNDRFELAEWIKNNCKQE